MTSLSVIRSSVPDLEAMEAALLRHPAVKSVSLKTNEAGVTISIVPDLDCAEIEREQLARWREVYEESFSGGDATDMLHGWTSSYTGEPLPRKDMEEWVTATVDRILELKPRHVVEIGSGTGLLVDRIAPHTESYVAIDAAAACQDRLSALIRNRPDLTHVRQIVADAADLPTDLRADTVILNSIVQYFPNAAYLTRVLERALGWMTEGTIFIGDIRDLRSLSHFYNSLARHCGLSSPEAVSHFVAERSESEEELAVDPIFFHKLSKQLSQIRNVRPILKRGRCQNELNSYRYDVQIHVGPANSRAFDGSQVVNLESLTELRGKIDSYDNDSMACLTLLRQRNKRLVTKRWPNAADAVDPEDVFALGAALGYRVDVVPSNDLERFDALFYRGQPPQATWKIPLADHPLTNDPALPLARSLLPSLLRHYLDQQGLLKDTDVFIQVGTREDRSAEIIQRSATDDSVEARLTALWRECLQHPSIDADDDFFACGGSSLLLMQLRKRITDGFSVSVPMSVFARGATPRVIAGFVQEAISKSGV